MSYVHSTLYTLAMHPNLSHTFSWFEIWYSPLLSLQIQLLLLVNQDHLIEWMEIYVVTNPDEFNDFYEQCALHRVLTICQHLFNSPSTYRSIHSSIHQSHTPIYQLNGHIHSYMPSCINEYLYLMTHPHIYYSLWSIHIYYSIWTCSSHHIYIHPSTHTSIVPREINW